MIQSLSLIVCNSRIISMVSKHTFLLLLIFIVHSNNAMQKNKTTWSFSQIITNFFWRCEMERVVWRRGYMSHTQQISQQKKSFIVEQKNFTEQDINIYLLLNDFE